MVNCVLFVYSPRQSVSLSDICSRVGSLPYLESFVEHNGFRAVRFNFLTRSDRDRCKKLLMSLYFPNQLVCCCS